ncbi:MAG TPA: YkvA family protein [Solirubrobacterales bacterium]|nr:YkvA family protein [Solirubrobacterales bacterium]
MSETFGKPFTKAEIEAMRRMAQEEARREAGQGGDGLPRKFFAKLKRVGQKIPFAEDILAAYFCAVDPATPSRVKLVLLGAIAYFVMPVDFLPDLLPLVGFADDAALLLAAISQVAGSINEGHREQARAVLRDDGSVTV